MTDIARTAATQTQVLALALGLTDPAQKAVIQKHLVAMLAMERRDKWEPIETAPKDGTAVLICEGDYVDVAENFYECDVRCQDKWQARESSQLVAEAPTHWRPLPTPPEGSEQP